MYDTIDETRSGCIMVVLTIFSFIVFSYFSYTNYMYCGVNPKKNPTVEGIIIKSSIEQSRFERRGYSIDVTYEYNVDGHKYLSNRVCCGSTANDFSKEIIEKYPAGSKVTVYYRADKPYLSVIEPRIGRSGVAMISAFGFLFLVTLLGSIFQAKKQCK